MAYKKIQFNKYRTGIHKNSEGKKIAYRLGLACTFILSTRE